MTPSSVMKKLRERETYHARLSLEGKDLEILLKVMNYHRISNAKDLLHHLLIEEYRRLKKKDDWEEKSE